MTFWIYFWGAVFFSTLGGFAILAVWVIFQGARDIGSMFAAIRERHDAGPDSSKEAPPTPPRQS
jgi:hypothetical protein